MAKIQPAVSTILINIPASPDSGTTAGAGYLDLSQCASILNRRFYRQGLNWAVAGFRCNQKGGSSGGRVAIEKLPETWMMSNAWHKVFASWKKQQDEALDASGLESVRAAFNDFKIHMDTSHVSAGFANNLLPVMSGGGTFTAGEWQPSQIVLPNSDNPTGSEVGTQPEEFLLHMVGTGVGNAASRGMISGYSMSRAVPQSPDPALDTHGNTVSTNNWLMHMFDTGNEDLTVLENVAERNNDLPYPQTDYPGAGIQAPVLQLHAHTDLIATTTAIDKSFFFPGTQVPCGLVKFTNYTDNIVEVFVDLVPGPHRGYLCEPMQEF